MNIVLKSWNTFKLDLYIGSDLNNSNVILSIQLKIQFKTTLFPEKKISFVVSHTN